MAEEVIYSRDITPSPDPTRLTTAQLLRETGFTKEILESRLDGMDKAIILLQQFADRTPTTMDIQHEVSGLREVVMEKFDSVDKQFTERDTRTDQSASANKIAIDAALQAQKEAVGKTELSFTKQIDAIFELFKTSSKATDDKFSDLKDRLTIIESYSKGSSGMWVALVAGISSLGVIATVALLAARLFK